MKRCKQKRGCPYTPVFLCVRVRWRVRWRVRVCMHACVCVRVCKCKSFIRNFVVGKSPPPRMHYHGHNRLALFFVRGRACVCVRVCVRACVRMHYRGHNRLKIDRLAKPISPYPRPHALTNKTTHQFIQQQSNQ